MQDVLPSLAFKPGTATLDLGCGSDPRNPCDAEQVFGVDIVDFGDSRIATADLALGPIPFGDQQFDVVTAYDFLEHVPRLLYIGDTRRSPFIEVMNEIHRVLKDGGILHSHTPAYPHREAFADPTHVNIVTPETLTYFTQGDRRDLAESYGFHGLFELVNCHWDRDAFYHLVWQLRAIH